MAEYYLADILFYRGRIDEAAALFEHVLAAQRRLYGASSRMARGYASFARDRCEFRRTSSAKRSS